LELASDVLALSLALNIVTPTGQLKWVLLSKLPLVRRFTEAKTVLVLVEAVNVAAIIVTSNAVDPGVIPTSNKCPGFMVSVSELSENAPVWLAPIEKVSFPLPEFLRNSTVDEYVSTVITRHHNLDIVPAGNGICCVDSEEAAYEEFEPSKHPLKVKKD
jgi:hypothetical protein